MPILQTISITPPTLIMGQSVQLQAMGHYDDGSTNDITSLVAWTKTSETPDASTTGYTLVTLQPNGLVLTPQPSSNLNGGSAVIVASLNGVSQVYNLTVTPLTITGLSFNANPLNMPFNLPLPQAQITATFNDGSSKVINSNSLYSLTWTSSNPTIASFIDNRGTMYFTKAGTVTLTASIGSISATTQLVITPTLSGLTTVGPKKAYVGQTVQLSLLADYNDGSSVDVSTSCVWTVSNSLVASVTQTGQVKASAAGTAIVQATYNGVIASFIITVPSLVSTEIVLPASAAVGSVVHFSAIQHYSDGSTIDVTSQMNWFSGSPAIGTITGGTLTCLAAGTVQIGAFLTGQEIQSVPYTVLPLALATLAIQAPSSSLVVGNTMQLVATGTLTNGVQQDLTAKVTWAAANPAASLSSSGAVTGQSAGLAVLVASFQGLQASLTLNIYPAQDENLLPQFRSHLTQVMLNYYDEKDVRVREGKYTIDAQLFNVVAQQLELSDRRLDREIQSMSLHQCPVNIDNGGLYWQQVLPANFDYTADHSFRSQIGDSVTTLKSYVDTLPVPSRVEQDTRFSPVTFNNPTLFSISGIGDAAAQNWAIQRLKNITPLMPGKITFLLSGTGFNQVNIQVRITGQRNPQPAWASRRQSTSETLVFTQLGLETSKFGWSVIEELQISNLPEGLTISAQTGTFAIPQVHDPARPYTDPAARDVTYRRYWTYTDGLLKEEYLASNYTGMRYIQSYATAPISAIAVEPNTYGLFLGQGSTLVYVDRREPLPSNLNAAALTREPYYGLDISLDETRTGPLRYVVLRPVPYGSSTKAIQYRYLVQTPQGSTYVLTPDGILANYTTTAGWRRGTPISMTIPLAQIGTYVITLQCVGADNVILHDAVPYPNLALTPTAQFDLSSIVPQIAGLSFDDRGRLWVWSGEFAVPLKLHYDAYIVDEGTQSIYLTDQVQSLTIDGVTV